MSDTIPWRYGQFTAALNRAGWYSIGQGCYVHQRTERKFYAKNSDDGKSENWKQWAEARQTPPPF